MALRSLSSYQLGGFLGLALMALNMAAAGAAELEWDVTAGNGQADGGSGTWISGRCSPAPAGSRSTPTAISPQAVAEAVPSFALAMATATGTPSVAA